MKRRIIEIDQNKCNGCGACAAACHEGAIAMVNGKAQLMRDDYCDGLGDCLLPAPLPRLPLWSAKRQRMMKRLWRKISVEGYRKKCRQKDDTPLRMSGKPVQNNRTRRIRRGLQYRGGQPPVPVACAD